MDESKLKDLHSLANAPENQPVSFDLASNQLYLNKPDSSDESTLDLTIPNVICNTKAAAMTSRPDWVTQFFERMNDYVGAATPVASISPNGELAIDAAATSSDLKEACSHLAWLYESQMRQNKEILVWIGEIILDYIARASHSPTVEEAIEELGFLDRDNGFKWKLKTLAKWPIVAMKIPHEIRQLPIPQTYLSEAAIFSQPEDPEKRVKFANVRDAMLLSAAENPEEWSRSKIVSCMKELQHEFGVESHRNEGILSLQNRLICLYRIQREVERGYTTYAKIGVDEKEVAAWLYNVEAELQFRRKLDPDPTAEIPVGDGLTKAARERILKKTEKLTNE
tara:strand:+ start:1030 stop:2043 length:1014 start_codon:yes stop_codon:yes gene_type:complete